MDDSYIESTKKRILSKVKVVNGCWEWQGTKGKFGYGQTYYVDRTRNAHRVSFMVFKDMDVEGLDIDHMCRNIACVNPEHLQKVTRRTNLLIGNTIARKNAEKTHCPSGHEYSTENTYTCRNERQCRICSRMRCKNYRIKKKNAILK